MSSHVVERCFSKLRRLKNIFEISSISKRLNYVLILHAHKDVDKTELDKLAGAFSSISTVTKSSWAFLKYDYDSLLKTIHGQVFCVHFF
jgi:uncharacterized protein YlbG (UPF0298 family)